MPQESYHPGPIPGSSLGVQAQPRTDGYAITALVTGLVGLIVPFAGVVAIIFGFMAKNRIKESGGAVGGQGMATAGFVLGIVTSALWLLWFAALGGAVSLL